MDYLIAFVVVAALFVLWRSPPSWRGVVLGVAGAILAYLLGRRRPAPLPRVEPDRRHRVEIETIAAAESEHVARVEEILDRVDLPRDERAERAADVVRRRRG
jgi:hypothetical protein